MMVSLQKETCSTRNDQRPPSIPDEILSYQMRGGGERALVRRYDDIVE